MHVSVPTPLPAKVSMPFAVLADPNEVVRHPGWVQAWADVRAGLTAGVPVLVTGLPGLGKSLLLKALAHALVAEGHTVILLPGEQMAQDRQPDVVLLDDADRVPLTLLRHLLGRAPRCVLAGSRVLLGTLQDLNLSPRLVEMRPLLLHEVESYLLEQIERAGLAPALLGPGTPQAIARLSQGNPRRLQKLASRAVFRAWMDGMDQVSTSHVADALAQDGPAATRAGAELPAGAGLLSDRPVLATPAAVPFAPLLPGLPLVPARAAPVGTASLRRLGPWVAVPAALCVVATGAVVVLRQGAPVTAGPPVSSPSQPPPDLAAAVPPPVPPPIPLPEVAPDPQPEAVDDPAPTVPPPEPPAPVVAEIPPPAAPAPPLAVPEVPAPVQAVPEPTAEAAAPALPPLLRPTTVPVHVVITSEPSDATAGSRGVSLVSALREAGLEAVLAIGKVPDGGTAVRYFFPADQAAAAQVARHMGEPGRERLAIFPGGPPRPGTILVVISSRSAGHRPANAFRPSEEKKSL